MNKSVVLGILIGISSLAHSQCKAIKVEGGQSVPLKPQSIVTVSPLKPEKVIVRTKDQYGNQWMVDEIEGSEEFEFDEPVQLILSKSSRVKICD